MSRPNIVWITLDSVRADHTTIGGYERETTPELARIASNGYGFDTCISHGKSTLPSSGAILTGYAPTRTTVGIEGDALPAGIKTVAERFREVGYSTACLSRNSYLSSATNLDRGFDRFQWLAASTIHTVGLRTMVKYLLNIRSHSAGVTLDTAKHASPFLMNEVAKTWLSELEGERPFFFYLHYNEPHRPYYPPGRYIDEFADKVAMTPQEAAEVSMDVHSRLDEIVATGCELGPKDWEALTAMYDAEIAYTDEMIGELVQHIRSTITDDTTVVVTSDHGELFGEHGLLSHSYVLDDAVTRVPLVVEGFSESLDVGEEDLIQHADVMTTLLRVAGAEPTDTIGVDLREESRDFAISQRGPNDFRELLRHNPDFDTEKFHSGILSAMRTNQWRYQHSEDGLELFELPDESTDVSKVHDDVAERLNGLLSDWLGSHGEPFGESEAGEFSKAAERQLRDLGYLE